LSLLLSHAFLLLFCFCSYFYFFFFSFFFFFNLTPTTSIYTLSLHDALPIFRSLRPISHSQPRTCSSGCLSFAHSSIAALISSMVDRKSTRLNSSHGSISYAVFCLKKKKQKINNLRIIIIKYRKLMTVSYLMS